MDHASDRERTIVRRLVDQADRLGDKPLISFTRLDEVVTYSNLRQRAQAGGARLVVEFKVEAGTVGATFLRNCSDVIVAGWCSLFAGLIDAPINPEYAKSLLAFSLATIDAQVVYTDVEGLRRLLDPEVAPCLRAMKAVIVCGGGDILPVIEAAAPVAMPPVLTLDELTAYGPADRTWEMVEGLSPAVIRFTSGTTGPAKAILQSNLHVLNRTLMHNQLFDFVEDDILYSPFPLHHNLAGVNGLVGTLQAGGSMVSAPRFSASGFWPEARACGATLVHLLRSISGLVMAQPPTPDDRNNKVRWAWAGPPDPAFEQRFGVKFIQMFGMGEVGTIAYKRDGAPNSTGNGPPVPGMGLQIVDAYDRPLPQGEVGEIVVRPEQPHRVMLGYYNNASATMRAFRNLVYHTGDAGYIGADGELHFSGRIGDTIRRRGVNISSEQIEMELRKSGRVTDCGVIGVPSQTGEEEIHACVIWAKNPVDEQDYEGLLAYLAERLPREYVPRYLEAVTDLPRTGTGKVRKVELKQRSAFGPTWDRLDRSWVRRAVTASVA